MSMSVRRSGLVAALVACFALLAPAGAGAAVKLRPYKLSDAARAQLKAEFIQQTRAKYAEGTWAPLRMDLNDRQLRLMGLPSSKMLRRGFSRPTVVNTRTGKRRALDGPTLATYAGAGWFGIRPGALLLTVTDEAIGWCSMAHVYGGPGCYQISTAGHCGNDRRHGTVIGVVGNREAAVPCSSTSAVLAAHRRRRHRQRLGADLGRRRATRAS